jgi:L-lactate dehydrogenase complex protein LldG
MSSKERILAAIAANKPAFTALPAMGFTKISYADVTEKFIETLTAIGGKVIRISDLNEVAAYIKSNTTKDQRVVSNIPGLAEVSEQNADSTTVSPHSLQDVELTVLSAYWGVAENGAVWLKEEPSFQRVLPFISQHLAIVLQSNNIVATMHDAYEKIGMESYGYAAFIAGPSKTADIEQSLVLGAHGPRTMTVFLMD